MIDLFRLLALYYACDADATTAILPKHRAVECVGHYTEIKRHFAGALEAPGDHARGYRAFKDWEAANPDLVRELRAL